MFTKTNIGLSLRHTLSESKLLWPAEVRVCTLWSLRKNLGQQKMRSSSFLAPQQNGVKVKAERQALLRISTLGLVHTKLERILQQRQESRCLALLVS